ncbi:MAG: sugar MFS transporter [Bacteroidales bacterium]|nr:sugar MFS transporter [Bacteroidales bacterium]MCF8456380.1 sugar MFS transporter [Bacteroidales bacterium]
MSSNKYRSALVLVTTLFFMWGFITCMNDILIPFVKKVFELSRAQSMLVQFSFFGAYFIGSLIYFWVSSVKGDPIVKLGYKKGIIAGLIVSAIGCFLFYPAAALGIYGLFLTALFVLGLGFTLLQIAANPYVAILGKPETASSRLNLSQGFNSFGTTIAPIIGGYLVFHYFAKMGTPLLNKLGVAVATDDGSPLSALGVQLPYLIFAGIFLLLAVIFYFTKLPRMVESDKVESGAGALRHKQLVFGMFAIFFYVGAEVSIGSALINYLNELMGFTEMQAKSYLALYWGGLMIGRFLGAVSLSDKISGIKKDLVMIPVALLAFFVIYISINLESGMELKTILPFLIFVALNLIAFRVGSAKASRSLFVFSLVIIALLIVTMLSWGEMAMWCVLAIGLFNSIMWSNIFTLAIDGLGKDTSQGSSLLVMMIVGGALLPLLMGAAGDMLGGYHYAFFIPMISYIYLAWYGARGYIPGLFKKFT